MAVSRVFRSMLLVAVPLAVMLASAGTASAATNPFGCRASAARVTLLNVLPVEPLVANKATTPCASASSGLNAVNVPTAQNPVVNVGPAAVYTYSSNSQSTTTGPVLPGATALTSVSGISIPTGSGGGITVAGPIQDQVSYECTASGTVATAHSSSLGVIDINGQAITLAVPGATQTIDLGGGSYVTTNKLIQTSSSLTEQLLAIHLNGVADIVVGEATVTQGVNPCAGTGTGTTGGGGTTTTGGGNPYTITTGGNEPSLGACPIGSTLDAKSQQCVIVQPNGTVIIVSRPFQGPTGGTVLALSVAKKLYRSECLSGKGPNYVIVGTNKADRINGTHKGERILGLAGNDRIAGQGGPDCIDAGAGTDKVYGGAGKERVYGGTGNDRLSVQNGSSYVYGGAGNDTIFLGNGNNHVYGGAGNDRFFAGNGSDHIYGGAGADRIFGHAVRLDVFCGAGRDIAYVLKINVPFAQSHGCETVRTLQLKR